MFCTFLALGMIHHVSMETSIFWGPGSLELSEPDLQFSFTRALLIVDYHGNGQVT